MVLLLAKIFKARISIMVANKSFAFKAYKVMTTAE